MSLVRAAAAPPGASAGELLERGAELAEIGAALEQLRRGGGSALLIEGPAGVGKSSLLAAAVEAGRAAEMEVLEARGVELDRELPFAVVMRLLEPALERLPGDERGGLLSGWAAPLATLLDGGGDSETEGAPALVHASYRVLAGLAARRGPLLVVLDDLQLADRASLRALLYLGARLGRIPVAVVAALRSGEPDAPHELLDQLRAGASSLLRPQPLSGDAVARIVRRSYTADAELEFCAACERVSAGNPFLLGELLEALHGDAVPATRAGAARLDGLIPDSVLISTIARLARLGRPAAELAEAVAVCTEGAPLRQAAALAGLTPAAAERAADALAAAEILQPGEPLRFAHPLIAAAVGAETPAFARSRMHRHAAELLVGEGGSAERAAIHLLESRPSAEPWQVQVLREAAARMIERGEPELAVRMLERALQEPPTAEARAEVAIDLGRAEAAAGRASAYERLSAALADVKERRGRASVLEDLSRLALLRFELERAVALAEQGLAELGEDTAGLEASGAEPEDPLARKLLARCLSACSLDPALSERARARGRALVATALAGAGPVDPELQALVAITMAADGSDRHAVRLLADRALGEHPLVDEDGAATAFSFAVGALLYTDELDAAEQATAAALAYAERRGAILAASTAHHWRAQALLLQGRLSEAVSEAEQSLEAQELGWELTREMNTAPLVRARLELGDLDAAEAALGPASAAGAPTLVTAIEARGMLRLARREDAAALADLRAAGELFTGGYEVRSPGVSSWRSFAAIAAARLGRAEEARRLAAEDLALAKRCGVPRAVGIALVANGLAAEGGRRVELLSAAVERLEVSPSRLELARALVELGAAQRRDGLRTTARTTLRRALGLAAELGAGPLADRAREELRVAGARPRRAALSGPESLTAAEQRVAALAEQGRSNGEIAAELFLSRKTVEWHLGNVYRKLDISSRAELAEALGGGQPARPAYPNETEKLSGSSVSPAL